MKISITGHETSGVITYTITPDSFQCLTVDAYKISNAIDLFNKGVETLINDIRHIEGIDVVKIKNLVIKYDLSNDEVDFELDSDAWYAYKNTFAKSRVVKLYLPSVKMSCFQKEILQYTKKSHFMIRS